MLKTCCNPARDGRVAADSELSEPEARPRSKPGFWLFAERARSFTGAGTWHNVPLQPQLSGSRATRK